MDEQIKVSPSDQEIQNVSGSSGALTMMCGSTIVARIFVDDDGVLNIQSISGKVNIGKIED